MRHCCPIHALISAGPRTGPRPRPPTFPHLATVRNVARSGRRTSMRVGLAVMGPTVYRPFPLLEPHATDLRLCVLRRDFGPPPSAMCRCVRTPGTVKRTDRASAGTDGPVGAVMLTVRPPSWPLTCDFRAPAHCRLPRRRVGRPGGRGRWRCAVRRVVVLLFDEVLDAPHLGQLQLEYVALLQPAADLHTAATGERPMLNSSPGLSCSPAEAGPAGPRVRTASGLATT
jgi:hypothetical protein